jgi:hypothetical protein
VLRSVIAVMLVVALPSRALAESVELTAVRDNTLFQDAEGDTSNGSGSGIFCGRNSQGLVRRALLAFNLTSALPAGARLDSASLVLHMASSSDQAARVLSLHRVLADWGEGGSASAGGAGAPAQAGDATWLHTFYPAPGGDHAPVASASISAFGEGDHAWRSETLTDDVRGWIDQGSGNFGWLLLGDESVSNTARRFDSRESATPLLRPRLVLHYSSSTPAPPRSWGRLKTRYR